MVCNYGRRGKCARQDREPNKRPNGRSPRQLEIPWPYLPIVNSWRGNLELGRLQRRFHLLEEWHVASPGDIHPEALRRAFPFEVLLEPGSKSACMRSDNIVVARIVIRRAPKHCLSDQPFVEIFTVSRQRLLTDVEQKG